MKIVLYLVLLFVAGQTTLASIPNECAKPAQVGGTRFAVQAVQSSHVGETIHVNITVQHMMCVQKNGQYLWVAFDPLTTYQRTTFENINYVVTTKRAEAILGTQNYQAYDKVNLVNKAQQELEFILPSAAVAADSPHGKLRLHERFYGKVEFSDGAVIDPSVLDSAVIIVDLKKKPE